MGAFDQAARYAAQAEPEVVVRRVLMTAAAPLRFREWLDTRTIPLPGGPERIADLVAALQDSATNQPWLLIFEFQAHHDPDKLDVTLEEAGILRARARHGEDRRGKYNVLSALVYLQGRCPDEVLEMTVSGGYGTRHTPLIWNVGDDDALKTLEAVAAGQLSWGMLFWVPLMAGGGEQAVIGRWKEVVTAAVQDRRLGGNLVGVALVFAELVGRRAAWKKELEGFMWTESEVVNEWISEGMGRGKLAAHREDLLETLKVRFNGSVPEEVVKLINEQDSLTVLHDWFRAALKAYTFEQFLDVLRR